MNNYVKIYQLKKIPAAERKRIMKRGAGEVEAIMPQVRKVMDDVQKKGDEAILYYMKKFDGVTLTRKNLKVTKKEIEVAYKNIDEKLLNSLKILNNQVQNFHNLQKPKEWFTELSPGLIAGQMVVPLNIAGCYTPGGRGWFPSTVFMNACPAKAAGVKKIIMCTPVNKNGSINPGGLVAMDMVGVNEIYKIAGAQAIAAMGFGTESIPESDIVVGPGSAWVVAAKMVLKEMGKLIGVEAGPGECLVLADDSANPEFLASDMIIQCEHGNDSAGVLVTTSAKQAQEVQKLVHKYVDELPNFRQQFAINSLAKYGAIIVVNSIESGIDFVNEYVVEHLQISTAYPMQVMKKIKNAGAFYLGNYSPMSAGCFCSGPNHVLPTAKFGRLRGGLTTEDFLKKITFEYPSKEGLEYLEEAMTTLADYETFYAHGNAIRRRFPKKYKYNSQEKKYLRNK